MKAKIATLLAIALACRVAAAADAYPPITTTDGKTYDHITDLRADPDGLYIDYMPGGKGMGSAKIKFTRLSADLQKQYGYDADAAKKYEDDQSKANLTFQAWADKQEAAAQKAREDQTARDHQVEMLLAQRMPVAPPPVMDNGSYDGTMPYDGGYYYGGGGGGIPVFPAARRAFTGTTFTGTLPASQLFTPLGFNPNQQTVIPATPRGGGHGSGVVVVRGGSSKGF
jgi:hypothetical protein